MFNSDFFPTPAHVIDIMGIDCKDKIVLEPSAGKGDIVDYVIKHGALHVLACEKQPELAQIVKTKAQFLKHDFLQAKPEEVSHVHIIAMNPPFSAGAEHVLHAWEIAPGGCEIIALLNAETIDNKYTRERRELSRVIEDYGQTVDLGNVFTSAERKTDVEVTMVKLYKPGGGGDEFDGFFMEEDEEEQATAPGLMEHNSVREIVQRYVHSVKKFDEVMELAEQMNTINSPFKIGGIKCEIGYDETVADRESYKRALQKKAWQYLFNKMKLDKYVTSGVMRDVNKFVEQQTKVPFTMKNVYKMFEIIVGTRQETFNRSLVEAVDEFTRHTHENRYNIEGWKTNDGHMLAEKFIVPWMIEKKWNSDKIRLKIGSNNADKLQDLNKVLCSLTGQNFDEIPRLYNYLDELNMEANTWYDWGFFELKGFYKGTMHLKFKDRNVWATLNRAYAKQKGQVLPEKI